MARRPTKAQARAADPRYHVWVAANAGTGKTGVLSDRVLRLMLTGAHPESILCITFTKAAAVEMVERIEQALARWAIERDDVRLSAELEAMEGVAPSLNRLARARQLYAQLLELPQGLPVMTIHSFCNGILRRFPIEAGLAPHFDSIDERTAAELIREIRASILATRETPDLQAAIAFLAGRYSEGSLFELFDEIVASRTFAERCFAHQRGLDGFLAVLADILGVEIDADPKHVIEAACADGMMDSEALSVAAGNLLASPNKTDKNDGTTIAAWLECVAKDRLTLFDKYKAVFLTCKNEGRKGWPRKPIQENHPAALLALQREQVRLIRTVDHIKAATIYQHSRAIAIVAHALIEGYRSAKTRRAALDFDDLIEYAAKLLNQQAERDWVLFKLDRRIDHILVDEAQDTSPNQWAVIKPLITELIAGAGKDATSRAGRTAFIVGDAKQSIYSFQGADLDAYRNLHHWLAVQGELVEERLATSFRSSNAILQTVDAVMALPECGQAVRISDEDITHECHHVSRFGEVLLWPLMPPRQTQDAPMPWALPDATRFEPGAEERLARQIAKQVEDWLQSDEMLVSTGQPVRPEDILILVARRGRIQELLINSLKRLDIPVAGTDRLALTNHLAVRDLMALGASLLLPEDDLTLACLLKSPLLDIDEEALFELCFERGKTRLIDRLRLFAAEDRAPFKAIYEQFDEWRASADFVPPFELFSGILDHGGRARMVRRLGADCIEPIDAFLGQTLLYEEGHPASLQGFMHWLTVEGTTLKRELAAARSEVRVMTVHASKGLEAPIVILADCGPHGDRRRTCILTDRKRQLFFWRGTVDQRTDYISDLIEAERDRADNESYRLLYVAMTRAQERLLIAGKHNKSMKADGSWHDLIARGMEGLKGLEIDRRGMTWNADEPLRRFRQGIASTAIEKAGEISKMTTKLPGWVSRKPPVETRSKDTLHPSKAVARSTGAPTGQPRANAAAYGRAFHKLLEIAGHSHTKSQIHIDQLIISAAPDLCREDRARLAHEYKAVTRLPEMQRYLGDGVRVEVGLAGYIGDRLVSGQIDRLLVEEDDVWFLDIKTSRDTAMHQDDVGPEILAQISQYGALLSIKYPRRTLHASLLYTSISHILSISDGMLDNYINRII